MIVKSSRNLREPSFEALVVTVVRMSEAAHLETVQRVLLGVGLAAQQPRPVPPHHHGLPQPHHPPAWVGPGPALQDGAAEQALDTACWGHQTEEAPTRARGDTVR